jgi:hypothetical protein
MNNGWARASFSFPLGWLLWRLRERFNVGFMAPWLALAAVCFTWMLSTVGDWREVGDLISVLMVYPLALIALARGVQPIGALGGMAAVTGALSYPLYATHAITVPLFWLITPGALHQLAGWLGALGVAVMLHRTVEPAGRAFILKLNSGTAPKGVLTGVTDSPRLIR